jgi:K+-sensing histidine kinase KdpD
MESFRPEPLIKGESGLSEPESPGLKSGSEAAALAEARHRADRYLLLSDTGRELMALRGVPDVCDVLYAQMKRLVDCTIFYIGLYSPERRDVDIVLKLDADVAYPLRSVRAVESLLSRAITSKQPFVRSASVESHAVQIGQDANGPRSAVFVPMLAGDRVVGAVAAHSFKERAYNQDDLVVLQALANQAAVAIENARFFEQTRTLAAKLDATLGVCADLHRCEKADQLGAATVRALQTVLPFDTYRIMLVEDDTQDLITLAYGSTETAGSDAPASDLRVPKGEGAFGRCAGIGEPVLMNDDVGGAQSAESLAVPPRAQSVLVVPLRHDQAVIGVLGLTKHGQNQYAAEHVHLLQLFADHVAVAITTMLMKERTNQQLDRLTALDHARNEFMSTARHELRAPLTSIIGFTETLLHFWDRLTVLRQREMVSRIQASSARLQRLVEDVLSHANMADAALALTLEAVDLATQIQQAVAEITTKYRGQVVVQKPPQGVVSLHADAHRVQQVVVNLLDNAAKYSPEGHPITVRWLVAGDFAEVSIQDVGPGIAEEDKGVLFTRYGKIDQPMRAGQVGTGLGLSISRQLVVAMGGTIWVESEPGQGSTFSFRLPLAREPAERSAQDGEKREPPATLDS